MPAALRAGLRRSSDDCTSTPERRPPKSNAAVYVKLDADVQTAKLHYGMEIARIFAFVFPKTDAWNMFQSVSCDYLRRVSYLIGA